MARIIRLPTGWTEAPSLYELDLMNELNADAYSAGSPNASTHGAATSDTRKSGSPLGGAQSMAMELAALRTRTPSHAGTYQTQSPYSKPLLGM
eukprot:CAMPEP_0119318976 /NCGR_PEP_ID=MMETSP1333-20130426/48188_1 /TAXON_ID=418940 /ORGANISM="Scyphosphaera apsteinii, Strain RCC1455" /LENGTH=92 /DNA_ID=CAMNT_0007325295 /DNA_START=190 /DNA_END=469 /DNA_ORIENTATION=+